MANMSKVLVFQGDTMIKNILIAFDGSKNSIAAAEAGINLAELAGAFITVVYVAEVIPPYMASDFAPIPGALGGMRNALLARAEGGPGYRQKDGQGSRYRF
jgi:nucleotide-binding universal stress UspA family protein